MNLELKNKLNENKELSPFPYPKEEHFKTKEKLFSLAEKIKGYYDFIISPDIPKEVLPEDKEEAEQLQIVAEKAHSGTLRKISEQLGSNEGGWYEDEETGKKYYVKFYKNPNQARVEFIGNAIYKKLGVGAVDSRIMEMGGKIAIVSEEIPGAQGSRMEDQKASIDVRSGFVADAYLANWDVVGLVFDNIVKGEDDRFYRIDNGGSLNFRAQGGIKDFSPDEIPELKNMLNLEYPSGRVFGGLTQEEMKAQAEKLIYALKDADIDQIVNEAGLAEDIASQMKKSLKGRKKVLAGQYGITEKKRQTASERIPVAIEKLREQAERLKGLELRPRVGILVDKDKIENQQIDVIDAEDLGLFLVTFKLTAEHYNKILNKIKTTNGSGEDSIVYGGPRSAEFKLSKSFGLNVDGIKVRISTGVGYDSSSFSVPYCYSALGLVQIEIQKNTVESPEDLNAKLEKVLKTLFEIPTGLEMPDSESEKSYKEARYKWHHKLESLPEGATLQGGVLEARVVRREVFPGYFAFVEDEKHKEYEAMSPFTVFHDIQHEDSLPKIIKAGGLMCTHERYRRGLILSGMSSLDDLVSGGGDSVFTRLVTKDGIESKKRERGYDWDKNTVSGFRLVFFSTIFDRTDWYAYDEDNFGRVAPEYFSTRKSPKELMEGQKQELRLSNEQMFRLGISMESVAAISCYNLEEAIRILDILEGKGIKEINGRPVEEFIVIVSSYGQLIEISTGNRGPETKSLADIIKKDPDSIEKLRYPYVADGLRKLDNIMVRIQELDQNDEDWLIAKVDNIEEVFREVGNMLRDVPSFSLLFEGVPVKYSIQTQDKLKLIHITLKKFFEKVVHLSNKNKINPDTYQYLRNSYLEIGSIIKLFSEELNKLIEHNGA